MEINSFYAHTPELGQVIVNGHFDMRGRQGAEVFHHHAGIGDLTRRRQRLGQSDAIPRNLEVRVLIGQDGEGGVVRLIDLGCRVIGIGDDINDFR